ncbi:hypothetical protein [Apilactobacillus xinyiensis]|uniref:hypothetical protein n=1 Tax=Apilactobacillus xinyiensis TaxID=2841032 RepID=UPI00200C2139|nr:hypothetical protein [Apilactobacillus xinyiensis]MCL0330628.1 hypothetical protein [Apilactobacillus xinyiensis]
MENLVNNLINSVISISIVVASLYKVTSPLIKSAIDNMDNKRNSMAEKRLQDGLKIVTMLADNIVARMAQKVNLSSSERFNSSVDYLTKVINKHGYNISSETIKNITEAAYQKYKNSNGDIHKIAPENNIDDFVKEKQSEPNKPEGVED